MRSTIAFIDELTTLVTRLQGEQLTGGQALAELLGSTSKYVPSAQYAGITLASKSKGITTPAATHLYPIVLDEIQQRHRDGPCLSAAWEHHTVRIDDLASDGRWPRYRQDALDETPIRSIMSFELSVNHDGFSALNFYAERPNAFDDDAVEMGLIFATHTALAWTTLRRGDQFRSALASRDILGQAKGILMERFDVDAMEAFRLLTTLSQQLNIKVAEIAQRLVDREHPTVPPQ